MTDRQFRRAPLAFAIALSVQIAPLAVADTGIEQIIVTAQKREQSLQETPIAISALTSDALEQQDIRDVAALNGMVPNLRLASSPGNANGATINIRGAVTINPALTMEPTVGLYLDGIYIGKNVGVFDVADLERVEVLRGPQGSLYGKNTLGGAINLITKKPSGEFGGDVRLTAGNYGLTSVKTSIDTPSLGTIGEGFGKLSAKVAYTATNRNGFIDNVQSDAPGALPPSGSDFGNIHAHSGRVALLWQPTAALDVSYGYDFSRSEQRPRFYQLTRNVVPMLAPFTSDRRLENGSANGGTKDNAYIDGHALTISWDAGQLGALGDVTFKSLTGHRQTRAEDDLDWDVSPYAMLETGRDIGPSVFNTSAASIIFKRPATSTTRSISLFFRSRISIRVMAWITKHTPRTSKANGHRRYSTIV
jgi:iron complex outermembrane receptor protein